MATNEQGGQPPLYQRLLDSLRDKIRRGEWPIGGHLPTEAELSEQYNVSRITVRHALALLEQDGVIRKARARRTEIVATGPVKRLGYPMESLGDVVAMVQGATLAVESYARERRPEAAELFGEKPDARLHCLRSVLKRDGRAYARSTIYFPPGIGGKMRKGDFDDTVVFRSVVRKTESKSATCRTRSGPTAPTSRTCCALVALRESRFSSRFCCIAMPPARRSRPPTPVRSPPMRASPTRFRAGPLDRSAAVSCHNNRESRRARGGT